MTDINSLLAEMARNGHTKKSIAAVLGISTRTLSERFRKKEFGSNEISILIKELHLSDP